MRPGKGNRGWLGVRWGLALSVLLHLGIAAAVFLVIPQPKKPKATPTKIPVEIVRPLEKKPQKKAPAKKKKPNQAAKLAPKPAPNAPKKSAKPKRPDKPKPALQQKPLPAKKAKQEPKPVKPLPPAKPPIAQKPKPKIPEPKITQPEKKQTPALKEKIPKPPERKTASKKPKKQLASKPGKPGLKGGGRKVKAKPEIEPGISFIRRNLIGRWVLQPLKVNLKHRCGIASITGVIELTRKRGRRSFGSLRTTIQWARCPAEGWVYKVELVSRGNRVVLRDSGGGVSRGLIKGNLMLLKDSYGRSIWQRTR